MADISFTMPSGTKGIVTISDGEGSAVVNGRTYYWDFHPYLGPTFTKKDGEMLKNQPSEKHPVWVAFAAWHEEYERRRSQRTGADTGG